MPFLIRRAGPEDLDAIGALTVRAYVEGGFTRPDSPYVARLRDARSRAELAELWVGEGEEGAVAGSVTFAPPGSAFNEVAGPEEAEIRMLGVSPEAHGRGLGEALVRHCIGRARALGLTAVVLSTQPAMLAAQRIYAATGFRRTPDLDWAPLPGLPLLTYRLDLHPLAARAPSGRASQRERKTGAAEG